MASVVQVLEKGEEAPESSSEPLAMKVKVLGMINRVLGSGQYDLSDVLRSVINLVIIEVSSGVSLIFVGVGLKFVLRITWLTLDCHSGSGAPMRACGRI